MKSGHWPRPLAAMFFEISSWILETWKRVTKRLLMHNINEIWPVVSEEKIVEIVDARRTTHDGRRTTDDGRRTTDIQGITKAHPEHSSGELIKKLLPKSLWQTYMKLRVLWCFSMHTYGQKITSSNPSFRPASCGMFEMRSELPTEMQVLDQILLLSLH